MRKVLEKSFCFLLIISIISSFALLHGASAEDGAVLPGSVTEKNRTSAVPDSKKLYEINISGTHDSAMAYCKNSTNNFVLITPDKLSGVPAKIGERNYPLAENLYFTITLRLFFTEYALPALLALKALTR